MKRSNLKIHLIIFSLLALPIIGCSGGGGGGAAGGGTSSTSVSGVVSAGPLNGATVTAYSLNSDGSVGSQLATTTSDASGNFSLSIAAQSSPTSIVATGGSYSEEATGTTVSMGNAKIRLFLATLTASQKIGITPVTEIAAQNALTAIATNGSTSLSGIINSSNATIASAMGLADITVPPANPSQPASSAASTEAAKYAIVLASICSHST